MTGSQRMMHTRASTRLACGGVALGVLAAAGCSSSVTGTPRADPASTSSVTPSAATTTTSQSLPIVDADLADDCLLTGQQMGALARFPTMTNEQTSVTQSDGRAVVSCFYFDTGGFVPQARIQVYRTTGAPVSAVLDQIDGEPVSGVGERASVVRADDQQIIWIAAGQRIATVRLSASRAAGNPAFVTAGLQAVAALATR